MTPLRLQMIEDMKSAGLAAGTQAVYIDAVRRLAARYRRSPDQLSEEEVRGYLLGLRDRDWALFQKKNSAAQATPSSRGPVGPASPLSSGLREEPGSQGLLGAHVRLRLAHKRGRDLGNRRHRQRQSAASHHRQGRQRAARAVATPGPGWPAGALEDPP